MQWQRNNYSRYSDANVSRKNVPCVLVMIVVRNEETICTLSYQSLVCLKINLIEHILQHRHASWSISFKILRKSDINKPYVSFCIFVEDEVCGSVSYGLTPVIACLPAWFRFAQCIRRYRDTRLVFPHIVNAGKYSTSFFVVLFSSLNTLEKSKLYIENI